MQTPSTGESAPGSRAGLGELLKNRNFGYFVGIRATSMLGQTIQGAAIMWQVYDLTGSPLALALVGISRFAPNLLLSFLAGAVTDTRDRRAVLAISLLAPLTTSLVLGVLTVSGTVSVVPIYLCVLLLGASAAFENPARQTLLPLVVPAQSFQRGVAVATTVHQLSAVFGPATAGFMIAQNGVAPAYFFHSALILGALFCVWRIEVRSKVEGSGGLNLAMIRDGIQFIRTHPPVLGAMALDMFAVIFAGADALLPIYARDILHVGAFGYGLLTSAQAVGALIMAIVLTLAPPISATGRVLVISIFLYGSFTVGFGLSEWFPLSLLLYAATAACDQISVVMRQSIIQLGTPNELRGRVSSVNQVFVGASNQLGAAESGLVASLAGSAVFAVVFGGVGCLVSAGALLFFIPSLWRHRQDSQGQAI